MVTILLADGFEEVEALAPHDVLRRAGVDVRLVGVTGEVVLSGQGLPVHASGKLHEQDPQAAEAVIIPGGLRGVQNILASGAALAYIKAVYEAGGVAAAICAGPTVLAKLQLTDGKRAVCYPGMENEMGKALTQPGARAVTDGNVVTGRSAGTAWDFALELLKKLRGPESARAVAAAIHYDHYEG